MTYSVIILSKRLVLLKKLLASTNYYRVHKICYYVSNAPKAVLETKYYVAHDL